MDQHLRAGVAVYNAGAYHPAHDAWEDRWLDLEDGTDDERLLHGLIQYTAAVHHATNGNWDGAVGLAESGAGYLAGLPSAYRGVDVERAREYLELLAADPERIERAAPWPVAIDGTVLLPEDLDDEALVLAAGTVADDEGFDASPIERAGDRLDRINSAEPGDAQGDERADSGADGDRLRRRLRSLLAGFVEPTDARPTILARLAEHLDLAASRDEDVEGLFE